MGSDDELLEEIERLSGVVENLRAEEQAIIQRNQNLNLLTSIAFAVNQSLELQEVVNTGVEVTVDACGVDGGLICLFDPATKTYLPAGYRGVSDRIVEALTVLDSDSGLPSLIAARSRPIIIEDLEESDEIDFPEALNEGFPCIAGFTIRSENELLGTMVLVSSNPGALDDSKLDFLDEVGDQIGRALAKARLYRHSKNQIVEKMTGDRQRSKVLKQIQERAGRLDTMVDALPSALLLLDPSATIILANNPAETDFADLIGAEEGERLRAVGETGFSDLLAPPETAPVHVIQHDGDSFQVTVIPLIEEDVDENESENGWVVEIRKCPALTEAATSDRDLDLMAEMVIGQVARHFDRSLGVIGLFAGISSTADLPAKHRERLRHICDETEKAESLNRELMDFARQTVYTLRPLSLFDLVRDLVEEIGLNMPDGINIEFVHSGEDFPVKGNPEALRKVFTNLTKNARQAMAENGQLRIALRNIDHNTPPELRWPGVEANDWIQLTVTDNGCGIGAEQLPRVFEPFFTTSEDETAHGMGLPQALGIVTQHGGRLDVISESGSGTTFAVHLPALVSQSQNARAGGTVSRAGSSEQLIIVTVGAEILRKSLIETLSDLGYLAVPAESTEDIIAVAGEHEELEKAVVFEAKGLDIGRHRSELLPDLDPDTKVILLSSASMDDQSVIDLGWHGWIQDPPQLNTLAEAVARVFRRN